MSEIKKGSGRREDGFIITPSTEQEQAAKAEKIINDELESILHDYRYEFNDRVEAIKRIKQLFKNIL